MQNWGRFWGANLQIKTFMFHWVWALFEKYSCSSQWAVSVLATCALVSNIAETLLIYMFVVMTDILFEQNVDLKFSVCRKVTQVSVSSQIGRLRYPPACVALTCCRTLTRCHTPWKQVDWKKFRAKWKFQIFAIKTYFKLQNTAHLLCKVVGGPKSGFPNKTITFSLVWSIVEKYIFCST
jgi:hypothetical protein